MCYVQINRKQVNMLATHVLLSTKRTTHNNRQINN